MCRGSSGGEAVELAFCNMRRRIRREMMLRNYLIEKIMHEIKGVRLNGHPTNRLPGNVNVSFSGVDGASLLILLYEDGICASGGSACNTGEERGLLCNRGVRRAGRICSGDRAHDVVGRDDKERDRPRRGGAQAES